MRRELLFVALAALSMRQSLAATPVVTASRALVTVAAAGACLFSPFRDVLAPALDLRCGEIDAAGKVFVVPYRLVGIAATTHRDVAFGSRGEPLEAMRRRHP